VSKLTGNLSDGEDMIKERIDKMKFFETKVYAGWLYRFERDYCKKYAQIHWELSPTCDQVTAGHWTREKTAAVALAKTIEEMLSELCPCGEDDPQILPHYSFDCVDWEEIANAFIEEFADRSRVGYSKETLKYLAWMENFKALQICNQKHFSRKQNWFVRLIKIFCKRG
jgi:hypothetical protein